MRIALLVTFLIVCAAVIACQPVEKPVDTTADVEAIRSSLGKYSAIIEAGDVEGFLAYFADSVVFLPPNGESMTGKDSVREWMQQLFSQFSLKETLIIEKIDVSGDLGLMLNTYTLETTSKAEGGTTQETGRAIWILKRQADNSWKGTYVIWNNDTPIPQEKP